MAACGIRLFSSGMVVIATLVACGGATESPSKGGIDAGSGGAATAAGGGAGSQGGRASGGAPTSGGVGGTGGRGGVAGSAGGAVGTGGAPGDGGPCNLCLPKYDLHWGEDGGLVAYVELSRLGPCASYSHERTPAATDPPSLNCHADMSTCPGSPLDGIISAMTSPEFVGAFSAHTLYGTDPRPVDGQVFRIGIGNDFVDIGPDCEADAAKCPTMPAPVRSLMKLLRELDTAMLAVDPCKSVFGP